MIRDAPNCGGGNADVSKIMVHDTHCDAEIIGPGKVRGKTVVLNGPRWNGILQHLHRGEKEAYESSQERQYNEYLREQSRAMTINWENSIEKIHEKKTAERQRLEQEKIEDGEMRFQQLKESDNAKRQEQIAAAQETIKRLKIGPRQLDSAYLLSDVLATRDRQCVLNAEAVRIKHDRHLADGQYARDQAKRELEAYNNQLQNAKKIGDGYKTQLREHIRAEEQRRRKEADQTAAEERKYRDQAERDLCAQQEKERAALLRKKELQRRNALEAMKMAEERRLRNKMVEELEEKIVQVYGKGSSHSIGRVMQRNERLANEDKEVLRDKLMQKITNEFEKPAGGDLMLAALPKAMMEKQKQYEAVEQARLEHARKMKAARIQQHLNDVERAKQKQLQLQSEAQFAYATRLKNGEVNVAHARQNAQMLHHKAVEQRIVLEQQMHANRERKASKDAALIYANETNAADDSSFFTYADQLLKETKEKRRPILPILKAIATYKKDNSLCEQRADLPHMKTNIKIGVSDCLMEEAAVAVAAAASSAPQPADPSSGRSIKYEIADLKKLNSPKSLSSKFEDKVQKMSSNERLYYN